MSFIHSPCRRNNLLAKICDTLERRSDRERYLPQSIVFTSCRRSVHWLVVTDFCRDETGCWPSARVARGSKYSGQHFPGKPRARFWTKFPHLVVRCSIYDVGCASLVPFFLALHPIEPSTSRNLQVPTFSLRSKDLMNEKADHDRICFLIFKEDVACEPYNLACC